MLVTIVEIACLYHGLKSQNKGRMMKFEGKYD